MTPQEDRTGVPDEAPERVELRYGLYATYVLREPPPPPPPPTQAPLEENGKTLPFPEPPPWGPVGYPEWYEGPR